MRDSHAKCVRLGISAVTNKLTHMSDKYTETQNQPERGELSATAHSGAKILSMENS